MPTFTYKTTVKGKTQTGEIEAENEQGARVKLKQKNIRVDSLKPKSSFFSLGVGGGGKKKQKITERDVVIFTRQFSTMVDAGLPLVQCLEILGKQSDNKTFGDIIMDVKNSIEQGTNLSDSMRRHPKVWDALYCNLVEAGEAGGILDTILSRLAAYIEKSLALKKKVKSAMVYPGAIVTVAFVVVAFLMIFVIPAFATMFEGSGAELPGPTAIVMMVSNFFQNQWYVIIGGPILFGIIFKRVYATEKGKVEIDRFALKLPVFGMLIRKVSVAKFTRTLGTLLSSGVPLIDAMDICARTSGNKIVERAILNTIESIKEGETIAAPLSREDVFPPMVIQMIDVGESAGALDGMLIKIADFYDEEVDTAVEGLTALLEPMLMVFLGSVVGFIVVAMYLPIFKMGENF
ncbi:type II secretion system F family protein [Nitrospina gracilis]|uniref:type II secretion system F family protein n=1 Tax=Nitrospina gracilis TaxID=35801 RepID=UPI001F2210D4|nr:type II secretion system F family protein [Nitrospina gracilis]MCF8721938.1 type IV pilus assembly protein PilC [Nitrospina gracilis Nb-211]